MSLWLFSMFNDGMLNGKVLEIGASMQTVGYERAWEVAVVC